jgi:hypothetical protein
LNLRKNSSARLPFPDGSLKPAPKSAGETERLSLLVLMPSSVFTPRKLTLDGSEFLFREVTPASQIFHLSDDFIVGNRRIITIPIPRTQTMNESGHGDQRNYEANPINRRRTQQIPKLLDIFGRHDRLLLVLLRHYPPPQCREQDLPAGFAGPGGGRKKSEPNLKCIFCNGSLEI